MSEVVMVLTALGPVIAAAIEAAQRGGDWRQAAREALDAAEAADEGLAGPRADAIEQRHRERLARGDEPTVEVPLVPTLARAVVRSPLVALPTAAAPRIDLGDDEGGG